MDGIKGYILENGIINGPKRNSLRNYPPDLIEEVPVYSVLLKHSDGCVLFDAGCHVDEKRQDPLMYKWFTMKEEDYLLNRLAHLKIAPEEIRRVIVSHLHADHTGFIEQFPNAEIYVHEDEFTNTVKQYALGQSLCGPDVEYWIKRKLNWKLVPGRERMIKLMEGVTVYNFGSGHSFGMLGLLVEFPVTGNVLLVSDAVFRAENIGPPLHLPGMVHDEEGYVKSLNYIARLAKEKNARIWYGHDMEQFKGLIKSTEGCYE